METQQQTKTISHVVIITIIISLAIASFTLCIICEVKKSKKKELRVDGELCFLPRSQAFGYGIASLICSLVGQIVGTGFFVFCKKSSDFKPAARTTFATILLLLSWMSFFVMVILIGTTTSMNRRQSYGEGWLDGKCYIVKNGIFVGSGMLVLIATSSMLLSCYVIINKSRAIHAQVK